MIEGPQAGVLAKPPVPGVRGLTKAVWERGVRVVGSWLPLRREADPLLWNLQVARRVAWIALVGLGIYGVVDLLLIKPKPRGALSAVASRTAAVPEASVADVRSALKPLSDYLAGVVQRNPFTGRGAGDEEQAVVTTGRQRLEELTSDLVVAGIDRGANPVALVEDTTQQRTYIVKVGDEIKGMLVKEISSEGVVVSYAGEELVLR